MTEGALNIVINQLPLFRRQVNSLVEVTGLVVGETAIAAGQVAVAAGLASPAVGAREAIFARLLAIPSSVLRAIAAFFRGAAGRV